MRALIVAILVCLSISAEAVTKQDICASQARFIYSVAEARDAGASRERVLQSIHQSVVEAKLGAEVEAEIALSVAIVYGAPRLTAARLARGHFERCMSSREM